jgi:hypothetical protein
MSGVGRGSRFGADRKGRLSSFGVLAGAIAGELGGGIGALRCGVVTVAVAAEVLAAVTAAELAAEVLAAEGVELCLGMALTAAVAPAAVLDLLIDWIRLTREFSSGVRGTSKGLVRMEPLRARPRALGAGVGFEGEPRSLLRDAILLPGGGDGCYPIQYVKRTLSDKEFKRDGGGVAD